MRKQAIFVLSVASTIGCKQPGEISQSDYDDVAQGIAAAVSDGQGGGDTGSMADGIALAQGELPPGFSQMGNGSFVGARGGLNYEYTLTCRDAATADPSACGPTTDIANLVVTWDGNLDLDRYDAAVTRTGDWTLSNILSDTARFNGNGTFTFDSQFLSYDGARTRTFEFDYEANYEDVLIDVATREPVGGEAIFDVSARRTADNARRSVEAEFDVHVAIAFAADGTALLTLDGERHYELTLANGTVIKKDVVVTAE
jgi:hypothetical protein